MFDRVWIFVLLYNLMLFSLIGFSIWYSGSLIPLFALVLSLKYSQKNAKSGNSPEGGSVK
jgi:hypothetical protein